MNIRAKARLRGRGAGRGGFGGELALRWQRALGAAGFSTVCQLSEGPSAVPARDRAARSAPVRRLVQTGRGLAGVCGEAVTQLVSTV